MFKVMLSLHYSFKKTKNQDLDKMICFMKETEKTQESQDDIQK